MKQKRYLIYKNILENFSIKVKSLMCLSFLRKDSSKGQSAMEYLMTYGWSILVIAIALVSLFELGFFNASSGAPSVCIAETGFLCTETNLYNTGIMSMTFAQSLNPTMEINGVACTQNNTAPTTFQYVNITSFEGEDTAITFQCITTPITVGFKFSGDVWIRYSSNNQNLIDKYAIVTASAKAMPFSVFGSFYVGDHCRTLIMNPNGEELYIAGCNSGEVHIFSTKNNAVVNTISYSTGLSSIALNPQGTLLYATESSSNAIAVISTSSNTVVNSIVTGNNPLSISFCNSGSIAYAINYSNQARVSVINVSSNTVVNSIIPNGMEGDTYFYYPSGVLCNPKKDFAYVTDGPANPHFIGIIDTSTNSMVNAITTDPQLNSMSINPAGNLMYTYGGSAIEVVDLSTNTVINSITGFNNEYISSALVFNNQGTIAYIPSLYYNENYGNPGNVSEIDVGTNTMISIISTGTSTSPEGIAINPESTFLYVMNYLSGTITVITI